MSTTIIADEAEIKKHIDREAKHIQERIAQDLTAAILLIDDLAQRLQHIKAGNFGSTMTKVLQGIQSLIQHARNMESFLKGTPLESKALLLKTSLESLLRTLDRQDIQKLTKNNHLLSQREQWIQEHQKEIYRYLSGQITYFAQLKTLLEEQVERLESEKRKHTH